MLMLSSLMVFGVIVVYVDVADDVVARASGGGVSGDAVAVVACAAATGVVANAACVAAPAVVLWLPLLLLRSRPCWRCL